MNDFTATQGRYLAFIAVYIEAFQEPPPFSEIAEAMKVSPPSVNGMIKTLSAKGLIRHEPGKARSIELLVNAQDIPKWNGRHPTRVVTQWVKTEPAEVAKKPTKRRASMSSVYRFKVSLNGIRPPIWRRIEVLDLPLARFNEAIQTAMGWTNSHLHAFVIDDVHYTDPRMMDGYDNSFEKSYEDLKISDLVAEYGPSLRLKYLYDYGDNWTHTVILESVHEQQSEVEYPRCTAGARACPPEDIGGIYGYANMLDILKDPKHPRYDEFMEWFENYDPNYFNLEYINDDMQAGLPELY